MSKTLIIAEAGVNHNGNIDIAIDLVDTAVSAGADIVKFQTFNTKLVASIFAPTAKYQRAVDGIGDNQQPTRLIEES